MIKASDQFTRICGPTPCSMCSRPLRAHTGWVAVKSTCRPLQFWWAVSVLVGTKQEGPWGH